MFTSGAKRPTELLMRWAAGHGNSEITNQGTEVAQSHPSILHSNTGGRGSQTRSYVQILSPHVEALLQHLYEE